MSERPLPRIVLHLDMDAFYAAVEVRENTSLAGRPLIIGHRGARGVVSTCSYEARKFGVHSAMPSVTAERLCPEAVWLPGRMGLYQEVSRSIRHLMEGVTPLVEPLSIDEAFLDMTGICRSLEEGAAAGRRLKEKIRSEEGLTGSVGVAPNKFLAKLASDLEKPDGLVVIPSEAVPSRVWPLPVERLWGVGPRTAELLHGLGLRRVGDVARAPRQRLVSRLGAGLADHLIDLAHGRDDRPVVPSREAKSISEERTYARDLRDTEAMGREMLARAEGVARQLRDDGLHGWTVHLKVRTGDFTTWTRALTLPAPTHLTGEIHRAALSLFRERIDLRGRGVRLLGVGVSNLEPLEPPGQAALFPDPDRELGERSARAEDAIRRRFGESSITRARLLAPGGEEEPPTASSPPAVD
ncbi:MAG TPA: DNA polymerase IV [Candidatus Saccharimonadales bacterium]|nr:DNA polymerase IV [Candidatus Saccharimonadales bacterium]